MTTRCKPVVWCGIRIGESGSSAATSSSIDLPRCPIIGRVCAARISGRTSVGPGSPERARSPPLTRVAARASEGPTLRLMPNDPHQALAPRVSRIVRHSVWGARHTTTVLSSSAASRAVCKSPPRIELQRGEGLLPASTADAFSRGTRYADTRVRAAPVVPLEDRHADSSCHSPRTTRHPRAGRRTGQLSRHNHRT
jgi:hypothetical protein